jgi:hypothetical protein
MKRAAVDRCRGNASQSKTPRLPRKIDEAYIDVAIICADTSVAALPFDG